MADIKQIEIDGNLYDIKDSTARAWIAAFYDYVYPVGSYYETSDDDFDPNESWGGTWVLEASGNVHVSAGTGYTIGATGGTPTVTLTKEQSGLPSHGHGHSNPVINAGGGWSFAVTALGAREGATSLATGWSNCGVQRSGQTRYKVSTNDFTRSAGTGMLDLVTHAGHSHTLSGGGVSNNSGANASQAHNNMPPYIVVNRWHRTA